MHPAPKIEPIKQNLDWAIRDWLLPRAKAGDLVVFYFAGQAAATVKAQGPKVEPRVDYYLLPIDASPDTARAEGLLSGQGRPGLRGEAAPGRLLAGDVASRPGWKSPAGSRTGDLATSRPSAKNWLAGLTRWRGVTVWLASDGSRAGGRRQVPTSSSRTRCWVHSVSPAARGTWRPASTTSRETLNSGFVGFGRSAACRPS